MESMRAAISSLVSRAVSTWNRADKQGGSGLGEAQAITATLVPRWQPPWHHAASGQRADLMLQRIPWHLGARGNQRHSLLTQILLVQTQPTLSSFSCSSSSTRSLYLLERARRKK